MQNYNKQRVCSFQSFLKNEIPVLGFVTWGKAMCFPSCVLCFIFHTMREKNIYIFWICAADSAPQNGRPPSACSLTGVFKCHHECLGRDSISREGNEANGAALVTDRLILWFALGGVCRNGYHNPFCVSPSPSVHSVLHVSPHVSLLNSHLSVLRHHEGWEGGHQHVSVRESPLWVTSRFML